MRRAELASRMLIGALILLAGGAPLWLRAQTPLLHARMAGSGGWTPGVLQAKVNEPLHLRLTSDDVMHGFAVGQMDMQSVDVSPGKVSDVTLTFHQPGTYTFYCTRWCGINHWRMRGTIEVSGDGNNPMPSSAPLYAKLGIDLDAPREAASVPSSPISATSLASMGYSGDANGLSVSRLVNADFYRSHSPYETWKELRAEASLMKMDDQQLWSLVAFIWQSNTSSEEIAAGQKLFGQNCAACHGEQGRGDGVFADLLAAGGGMIQRPANLTDPKRMLAASPALLEGKILRGGMGTGMPSWGPIFTESDSWKIVSYLYTLQFKEFSK